MKRLPSSPLSPVSPLGPAGPVSPLGPAGPVSPLAPAGPVDPVEPAPSTLKVYSLVPFEVSFNPAPAISFRKLLVVDLGSYL